MVLNICFSCVRKTFFIFCRILIRLYKQRGVFRDDQHEDIGVLSEHQQEMDVSANGLELEEISQNEIGDIEEEVITVEYVNLTSQRVPIGQFLEELPNRKDEGILEKEFDVCLNIFINIHFCCCDVVCVILIKDIYLFILK